MSKQKIKILELRRYLGILSQMSTHSGHQMTYEINYNISIIEPIIEEWRLRLKEVQEKKPDDINTVIEKFKNEETEVELKMIEIDDILLEKKLKMGIFEGVTDLGSLYGKIIIITENGESNTRSS